MLECLVDFSSALKRKFLIIGKLNTDEVFYGRLQKDNYEAEKTRSPDKAQVHQSRDASSLNR
jgi:hypothetical protein